MTGHSPEEDVARRVLELRGKRVLLDRDLAVIYRVKPIVLRQQVRRNANRFPADFMFQLTESEARTLVAQGLVPAWRRFGGAMPFAFTQEGVAMLSGVLKSPWAVDANISIMRAFVMYRERLLAMEELARRVDQLEEHFEGKFKLVFDALRRILTVPRRQPKRIGFRSRE